MKMPKSCCEFHEDTDMVLHCPLYNSCDKRTTIKVNFKPVDCPLIEIVTCEDCRYRDTRTEKNGYAYCTKKWVDTYKDHFCADRERRE